MIYVGTSGWQYASWRGRFYPPGLPQRGWLAHYATRFPVVEVNNSFYMLPRAETFLRWREETPEGFLFAVKANRFITHIRRLREAGDPVALFWSRATLLGDKLGPVLFQLPPNFRADPALLAEFLGLLPAGMRAAFEFREPSWWRDEVYDLLDRSGAAWVLADRPGARVPLVVTGGWSYLRFHQGRRDHPGYTRAKLRRWADRVAGLGVEEAYLFFNNDPLAAAPRDALTITGLLRDRGQEVAQPPA
jgi:uncharacterized protein YecE (DUF72 family)